MKNTCLFFTDPRLRHSWRGHDILHFMFSDSITKYHVSNATLYVYVKGAERRPLPDVLIEVFKVYKIPDHPETPGLYRMISKKVTQPLGRGDWVKLDMTITVSEWFKNPPENFGFVINGTANGKKVVLTDTKMNKVNNGTKVIIKTFIHISSIFMYSITFIDIIFVNKNQRQITRCRACYVLITILISQLS